MDLMQELPDPMPRTPSDGVVWGSELPVYATAEERVFAAELAELDRQDRESQGWYDADLDEPPFSEVAPLSDDEVVAALAGQVHPADLLLLESIDPRSLSENLVRVDYLRALDRVEAFTASLRHKAIVSMAGATSTGSYLDEVHVEHELAVARHTSRYAAGGGDRGRPRVGDHLPRVRRGTRCR